MFFTVVTATRVLQIKAKSIQHATRSLTGAGIEFLSIVQVSTEND